MEQRSQELQLAREGLGRLAFGVMLGRGLALILRELLVLRRAILRCALLLLVRALAPQRRVSRHVAGSLLRTSEQLVEPSHVWPPSVGFGRNATPRGGSHSGAKVRYERSFAAERGLTGPAARL